MGNEAIVRAALEDGVQFVSTYPGTPASEIGDLFSQIGRNNNGVYFEFSTNEKLALEASIGASFSGLKCLVVMKSFGINVALESLLPFAYTGCKGPTVIIVADDPSCHSSAQSEENSRGFAYISHLPFLEPANPQECFDFVKLAYQLSEQFKLPIIVRTTTRVAHQKAIVEIGNYQSSNEMTQGHFEKNKHQYVTMPPRVMEMHQELLDKIKAIKELANNSAINILDQSEKAAKSKVGIITSGVSYLHIKEALQQLKLDWPILKLGFFYPLAEQKIKDFLKGLKQVLVAEELDPYLEREITALAKEANPKIVIWGKNVLPETGELRPEVAAAAIAKIKGKDFTIKETPFDKISHIPRFCSGGGLVCPYWKVFAALKKALNQVGEGVYEKTVFGGDIGCYMIAALPPHNLYDFMFCMGSSIGISHGIAKATNGQQKVIAFMGDGTFFHSGMAALLNAVYNQSNILVIIVDNRITAMTGHQPNPGMQLTGEGELSADIKIENVATALGVKNIRVVDQHNDFEGLVNSIQEFYQKNEVSVIVARHICALLEKKSA